jgi:hypothetical protein
LFARHIRRIMQNSFADPVEETHTSLPRPSDQNQQQIQGPQRSSSQADISHGPTAPPEPYVFDMTDDQILEAINSASTSQDLFHLDETMFFDWLDWPNVN